LGILFFTNHHKSRHNFKTISIIYGFLLILLLKNPQKSGSFAKFYAKQIKKE